MDFNSPLFLFLFLPLFFFVYVLTSGRNRMLAGIAGSLLFYAWGNLTYIPLMAGMIVVNYFLGLRVERLRSEKAGLWWLWGGVLVNLAVLVVFKWWTSLAYPLGLSYVSFQVIAYLLEIHKKDESEKDFLKFAYYVLLFPKILVGPINRYGPLKKQLDDPQVSADGMADGIRRFLRGLAKKALIADTLARTVAPIFALESPTVAPWVAWLVLVAYALQLYFDFSGYTDMALGLGRMMGLSFIENFNFPYLSKNIGEFWRRWHISLSNWFRDFVFYPLERRRLPWIGQPLNILIVFALTGLWHGLSLTFVVWGLVHGLALVFESTWLGRKLRQAWAPVQHLYALVVILAGWVFFRSPSLAYALQFFQRLAGNTAGVVPLPFAETSPLPIVEPSFVLALVLGLVFSLPLASWVGKLLTPYRDRNLVVDFGLQIVYDLVLLVLLVASIAATASGNFAPSIYGKF